ncbi:MAG: hypothetical protein WCD76_21850 [Pyrinomonadaceae bacterium]
MKDKKRGARTAQSEQAAGVFEPNAFYERLLEMREQNPTAFHNMSGATRTALEAYVKARQSFSAQATGKVAA